MIPLRSTHPLYTANLITYIVSGIFFLVCCSSHRYVQAFNLTGDGEIYYYGLYMHCIAYPKGDISHSASLLSDVCVDHSLLDAIDNVVNRQNLTFVKCCKISRALSPISEIATILLLLFVTFFSFPQFICLMNVKSRVLTLTVCLACSAIGVFNVQSKTLICFDRL
ncbi:hypothetical protein ACOME3_004540 [Neoechinorhynchus agilis]